MSVATELAATGRSPVASGKGVLAAAESFAAAGLAPIVEPEVLPTGDRTLARHEGGAVAKLDAVTCNGLAPPGKYLITTEGVPV